MGVKLKSLRPAVGSYGNVAANGIVEVDEAEAVRLRKTGRFVDATTADIKAARKAQDEHMTRAVAGGGVFAPMPEKPSAAAGPVAITPDQPSNAAAPNTAGSAAVDDAGNEPNPSASNGEAAGAAEPPGEAGKAAEKAGAKPAGKTQ